MDPDDNPTPDFYDIGYTTTVYFNEDATTKGCDIVVFEISLNDFPWWTANSYALKIRIMRKNGEKVEFYEEILPVTMKSDKSAWDKKSTTHDMIFEGDAPPDGRPTLVVADTIHAGCWVQGGTFDLTRAFESKSPESAIVKYYTDAEGKNEITDATKVAMPASNLSSSSKEETTYYAQAVDGSDKSDMQEIKVTFYQKPEVSLALSDGKTEVCRATSITLKTKNVNSFTPGNYHYYSANASLNTGAVSQDSWTVDANADANADANVSIRYYVYVTSGNSVGNCKDTAHVDVTVKPVISGGEIAIAVKDNKTEICSGESVELTASVPGSYTGTIAYQWGDNVAATDRTGNPIIVKPTETTSYAVYATLNGCNSAGGNSQKITVNPLPNPTVTNPAAVCGGTVDITQSGSGTFKYYKDAESKNPVADATTVGAGTYYVTLTDGNGCVSEAKAVTATVNTPPTPKILVDGANPTGAALCAGTEITLSCDNTGYAAYTWTGGTEATNPYERKATIAAGNSNTFTLTVQDANGCTGTATAVTITGKAAPSVTIDPVNAACVGSDVTLTAKPVWAGGSAGTVSWSGNVASASSATTTATLAGGENTYTVTVTENACTATASVQVTGNELTLSPMTVNAPNPLKAGSTVNVSIAASWNGESLGDTGAGYVWKKTVSGTETEFATTRAASDTPEANTTYKVIVTKDGCEATAEKSVTVQTDPFTVSAIVADRTTVCDGDDLSAAPVKFYVTAAGGQKNYTYAWTVPAGMTVAAVNTDTLKITAVDYSTISAGANVKVSVEVSDASTPANTKTQEIYFDVRAIPTIMVNGVEDGGTILACKDVTKELTASIAGGGTATYAWSTGATSAKINAATNDAGTSSYKVTATYGGCTNDATVSVTVNELPELTLTATAGGTEVTKVCPGTEIVLTAAVTGESNPALTWSMGANGFTGTAPTTTVNAQTRYAVSYTDAATTCQAAKEVSVDVFLPVKLAITVTPSTTVCAGSEVKLTASNGASYQWAAGGSELTGETGAVLTVNPTVGTTYTVSGKDSNGCDAASDSKTISITPAPQLAISNYTLNGCEGSTLNLANAVNTGNTTPGLPLKVKNAAGDVLSGTTVTEGGEYTLYLDGGGDCNSNEAKVTAVFHTLPNITLQASTTEICHGEAVTLTASSSDDPKPAFTYNGVSGSTWTVNPTNTGTAAATQTYTVTAKDNFNCTKTESVTVNVKPLPNVQITNPGKVCASKEVTLTATGADTYSWTGGLTPGSGATYDVTPTTTNNEFTVVGTKDGCQNDKTITLTVEEAPVLGDPKELEVCLNGKVDLNTAYTVGYSMAFFAPDKTPLTSSTVTVTGDETYYVKAKTGDCSTDFKAIPVTAKPLPSVAIVGNNEVCAGGETTLTTSGDGVSWTWSPAGKGGAAAGASIDVNPAATTTYTVTATGGNNCTATASVEVTVNPLPALKWDGGNLTSLVAGNSGTWNVVFDKATTPNYTYTWKHNGDEDPAYKNDNYYLTGTTNPEELEVFVTDGKGCRSAAIETSVPVTPQGGELSVALASRSASDEICQGGIQILTATPAGGRVPYTYTWYKNGTDMGLEGNPASITVTDAATYKVVVTDAGTPAQNADKELEVKVSGTLTAPAVAVTDLTIPVGNATVLWASVTPADGNYTYQWGPADDLKDASQVTLSAPETKLLSGDTRYEVIVKAGNGCYNRATGWVRVDNSHGFKVTATADPEKICVGNTAQLTATLSGNVPADAEYEWIPATGLSDAHVAAPVFTATVGGNQEYVVKVTGDGGYTAVAKVNVEVESKSAPVLVLPAQGDISCVGQAITVSVQGGSISGAYQWSIDGRDAVDGGATLDTLAAGNRHVKVSATAQNGCAVSAVEADYLIHDLPVIAWGPDVPAVVDKNSTLTVTAIADNGNVGNYTYNWKSPTGGTANRGDYTVSMNNQKKFTVSVTNDDTKCESLPIDTTIKIQAPTAAVEIAVKAEEVALCLNGVAVLEVTGVKGGNGVENDFTTYTYAWKDAGGTVVSTERVYAAAAAGTYTVKVTEPKTSKSATKEITVTNGSSLAPDVADATQTIPTGNAAFLFASVTGGTPEYTYCWQPESLLATSNTRVNPTTSNLSDGQDFTCYVTDANGCSGAGNIRVDVVESDDPKLFDLTARADNPTPCKGNAVQLSATPSRTLTNPTYEWTPATDLSAANTANPVLTANTSGTLIYTVKATEENGYSVTAQVKVTLKALDAPRLELSDNTDKCAGEKLTVENKNTAATVANYHWVIDGVADNSVTGPEYPLGEGMGQVVKVYADATNGCTADTVSGVFDRKPTPTIAWNDQPTSAMEGDDFTVSVTSDAGVTYVWKSVYTPEGGTPDPEEDGPDADEYEIVLADKGTYLFTVYAEKEGCRSETLTHTVTVLEQGAGLSVITDYNGSKVCENGSAVVTATAINASGDCTYTWYAGTTPSGTPVATGRTAILSPSSNGQQYIVQVNDGTETATSSPIRLTFNDYEAPAISGGTQYVAAGHSTVLLSRVTTGAATGYHWSSPNNLLASGEETKPNPVTAVLSDDETYTYYVTDDNGCVSKPADVNVVVDKSADALAIEAGADMTELCRGNAAHLGVTAVQGTLPETATYEWTPSTHLTGANTAHPVFETVVPGSYTYFVKVSDGGRDYYASVDLTVKPHDAPEIAWDQVPASYTTGSGFAVTTKVTKETTPPYAYHWLEPEVKLNDPESAFTVQTATGPQYRFTVYMTDENGCQSTDTLKTEVSAEASGDAIEIAVENVAACAGGTATLRVEKKAGPDNVIYAWTSTEIPVIENANTAEATAQLTGIAPGVYTVRITVTAQDDNTNSASEDVKVSVNASPVVKIDRTCLALHKDSAAVLNIADAGNYDYLWQESKFDEAQDLWQTPEDKGDASSVTVTMHDQRLRYILTGTMRVGASCSASDTAVIYRIPDAPVLAIDTNTNHLDIMLKWGAVGDNDDYTVWSRKWDPYCLTGGSYTEKTTTTQYQWAENSMDTLEFYYVTANKNVCGQTYRSVSSDTVGYYLMDLHENPIASSLVWYPLYFDMSSYGFRTTEDLIARNLDVLISVAPWDYPLQDWGAATTFYNPREDDPESTDPVMYDGVFDLEYGTVIRLEASRDGKIIQYGHLPKPITFKLEGAETGSSKFSFAFIQPFRIDLKMSSDIVDDLLGKILSISDWNFDLQGENGATTYYDPREDDPGSTDPVMYDGEFLLKVLLPIRIESALDDCIYWKK